MTVASVAVEILCLGGFVAIFAVAPLGFARALTSRRATIVVHRAIPSGPDDVEGAERIAPGIYRGHMRTRLRMVAEEQPYAALPASLRSTVGALRFVVCCGFVIAPLLAVCAALDAKNVGEPHYWGNWLAPFAALTFGQLFALKRLGRAATTARKTVRFVGSWTIVQNIVLVGFASVMASRAVSLTHVGDRFPPCFFAALGGWALFGIWLGSRTFAAATTLERWVAAENLV